MAQKPQAPSAKKKAIPKKKGSDEKQFERFVETARELGVDESGKEFEDAFKKVAQPKKN
jgi:hypothetical protein